MSTEWGAVQVHVLVVDRPDVRQGLVTDVAAVAAQGSHAETVVLRGPAHDCVGGQRETPHLLGLLLVVTPAQRSPTDGEATIARANRRPRDPSAS